MSSNRIKSTMTRAMQFGDAAWRSFQRNGLPAALVMRQRRHFVYPLLALAALTMASGAMWFAHHTLATAYAKREEAQQALGVAQQQLTGLLRKRQYAQDARTLMEAALQAGYGPGRWATRRLDIQHAAMSRETFNDVLSQIARNPLQMFGADNFELSVKSAGGSLFEAPVVSGENQSLSVTLSGTLYFRLGAS